MTLTELIDRVEQLISEGKSPSEIQPHFLAMREQIKRDIASLKEEDFKPSISRSNRERHLRGQEGI